MGVVIAAGRPDGATRVDGVDAC